MNRTVSTREHSTYKPVRLLALAVSALTLTACSLVGDKMRAKPADPIDTVEPVDYKAISHNLVDVLSQFTRLNPQLATVQISPPDNKFERQVHQELTDQGYKLEKVNAGTIDKTPNGVSADVQPSGPDSGLYVLTIGEVSVERQYASADAVTLPQSEVVIRGDISGSVKLNDTEVFNSPDSSLNKVAFIPDAAPEVKVAEKSGPGAKRDELLKQPKVAPVQWNVYDTLQSNYVSLYSDYEDIERNVLIFPNDSLRLGETNKQIIDQYVSKMDPETDVLSVIGCSHGASEIENGNSLLALGRANRVKEAFLFSGVAHEQVMEEGCWAPETFDEVMPRRGVVLTLKRRKNS